MTENPIRKAATNFFDNDGRNQLCGRELSHFSLFWGFGSSILRLCECFFPPIASQIRLHQIALFSFSSRPHCLTSRTALSFPQILLSFPLRSTLFPIIEVNNVLFLLHSLAVRISTFSLEFCLTGMIPLPLAVPSQICQC